MTRRDVLKAAAAASAALMLGDSLRNPNAAGEAERADWMGDRFATLKSKALREMVIPGAHDAGMYKGNPFGFTQDQSLYGQLRGGIRYFDLRPSKNMDIEHGICKGPPVEEVLDDIKRYMAEGHRELVILKFSHYGDGFSDDAYRKLAQMIRDTIGAWLLPKTWKGRLADVALGALLAGGGQVVVAAADSFPVTIPNRGIYVYRDWDSGDPEAGDLTVYDQYSNTVDYEKMSKDQLAKLASFDGTCKKNPSVPCDLFLLSWTLTPPTLVSKFAKTANRQLGAALASVRRNSHGRIPNILYVDYFELSRTADVAIEMNKRL